MKKGKIKFFKQLDAMRCGASCLRTVCRYHGLDITAKELDSLCATTAQGVSVLGVSRAAEALGFDTFCAKCETSALVNAPLPCILHWRQNHFVVLHKIDRSGNRFHICDPGKGKIRYSLEEFREKWASTHDNDTEKGIALLLAPGKNFPKEQQPCGESKISIAFLGRYMREYRKYFVHIFAGLLFACILQLIFPFLTQGIVDLGIRHRDIGIIWLILLGELVIVIGQTVTSFIRSWLLMHISLRINLTLVSDFFIKLLKLPMAFFDTKLMGDLLQRIVDHGRVQSFLTGQVLGALFSSLSLLIFVCVLAIYSVHIFLVFVVGSLLYAVWISSFLKRRKVLDYELFECESANRNHTYQFLTTIQEIKLQNCGQRRRCEWEDAQADLFDVQLKTMKLRQIQDAGAVFINQVKNIVITVMAASAVINGELTLGGMLAIQFIIGQLNSPVEQLMDFIYSMQDVKISLERINEIHMEENEERTTPDLSPQVAASPDISFCNVVFRYDPNALTDVLKGISFDIPYGKVTAIVGASGSGKSTIIKLLLKYYRLNSGAITLNGKNIDEYSTEQWRQQCGVVMQDGVIFSESIARNIAVDDNEIDIARLQYASKVANVSDFVERMPLKYDTIIGRDGIGLSQGQKQRILIARAVYKNPRFLVLDEATNSLDAENESRISANLDVFYKGRTVVIVAHRLSTVKKAHNIIVLDKGAIVESGTHRALTDKRGAYYNLVKNQLELGN